jgi:hypothetical protein
MGMNVCELGAFSLTASLAENGLEEDGSGLISESIAGCSFPGRGD